jgi:predicted membrane-bound dolichyl-phosphate-mannose-protein mannosyltransferase
MVRRTLLSAKTPLVLLAVVSVLSLGARALMLGEPCQSPCRKADQHTLIFDEAYYVNAARVIAGLRPPKGAHYADAPPGVDPNAEHPQLAKLIMAGAIELFGDGPFAWRIGSLIFGTLAILGMFALVRSAGGGRWTALGAATLMACDNLLLIHGRIGTLDIYAVAMMIWGAAVYLRGRPVLAGLVLAVAAAFKLVAPYVAAVLVVLELIRVVTALRNRGSPAEWRPWPALRRLVACIVTGVAGFIGLLALMDRIATPYDDAAAKLITGGPFSHLAHMITYAAQQTSPNGPRGIASYPWQWLLDLQPITYLRINPSVPGNGLFAIHPVSKFLGMMSPPIMAVGVPALLFAAYRCLKLPRVRMASDPRERVATDQVQLAALAVSWFLGTWIPFVVLSLLDQRTSYIYYMVIVMPGLYVAAAYAASQAWRLARWPVYLLVGLWAVSVLVAAILMYPFVPTF